MIWLLDRESRQEEVSAADIIEGDVHRMSNIFDRPNDKNILSRVQKYSRILSTFVLLASTLVGVGCAAHRRPSTKVDATLEAACLTRPIALKGCDFSVSPLKCRKVTIAYRKGCEHVDFRQALEQAAIPDQPPGKKWTPMTGSIAPVSDPPRPAKPPVHDQDEVATE